MVEPRPTFVFSIVGSCHSPGRRMAGAQSALSELHCGRRGSASAGSRGQRVYRDRFGRNLALAEGRELSWQ